jgi:hypothetical protein
VLAAQGLASVVDMTTTSKALTSSSANDHDLVLRLAASAYLGRYTGISRTHTESDLRLFFAWCTQQRLAPGAAQRVEIERTCDGCKKSAGSSEHHVGPAGFSDLRSLHQHDLRTLPYHAQHAVAVFLAELSVWGTVRTVCKRSGGERL